jgi:hypothetical protein
MNVATGVRRFIRPKFLVPGGLIAVALAVFVIIWFQPQKLFFDQSVDEKAPPAASKPTEAVPEQPAQPQQAVSLSGSFRSLAHPTSGQAILEKAGDGNHFVRFENFQTENGPDVRIYLSTAPGSASGNDLIKEFIDLGTLKGNVGSQNYQIPSGTDVTKYKSVVVWCRRFKVGFGVAPLEA